MSTSGNKLSPASKRLISIANTKDRTELLQRVTLYIKNIKSKDFPSITDCAISCGISEKNLLAYELRTPEDSDIRILLDQIREIQKQALMHKGLSKIYDSGLVKFLLIAHHGLKENPTQLTQNNTFNVSPEILAEAIEITRKKK